MDADVASFVERHDGFSFRSEVSSKACRDRSCTPGNMPGANRRGFRDGIA